MDSTKRVFVTGGTGMVGSRLIQRLVEAGARVRALARTGRRPRILEHLPVEWVQGDLDDIATLTRAMDGCQQVFHVAGVVSYRRHDEGRMYRTNVLGTRNVLVAASEARVERVVHTSSTAAVGLSDRPECVLDETAPFEARFQAVPYMWTKHLAEIEVAEAVGAGLDVVIVNPSTILGTGDVHLNSGRLFQQLERRSIRMAPPGGNSVVSLDDVVTGHMLAMDRGVTGRRYILSAENMTHREMFTRIAQTLGQPPIRHVLPRWTGGPLSVAAYVGSRLTRSSFTRQVVFFSWRYRYFNASRARTELGWIPAVRFDEAAADACRFYRAQGLLPPQVGDQVPMFRLPLSDA